MSTSSVIRDSQTLQLPDGRTLGFAEYGPETGHPLLYFHGFPGCRLEAFGLDKLARRRNIRIIASDRPGYGLTTLKSNGRIVDWPADVKSLAQHLNLSHFSILGVSGGGPYAVACAHALPHEMISSVGLVAPAGPWEAGKKDLPTRARILEVAATYTPSALTGVTNVLFMGLRYIQNTSFVTRSIDKFIKWAREKSETKPEDATSESIEEKRARLLRLFLEPFAQGAAAFTHDAQLLSQSWDIKFEDVTYDKIQLWHGKKDTNSPIWMSRYMVERLPHSVLTEFEDDDHYTIGRHFEKIASALLPSAGESQENKNNDAVDHKSEHENQSRDDKHTVTVG